MLGVGSALARGGLMVVQATLDVHLYLLTGIFSYHLKITVVLSSVLFQKKHHIDFFLESYEG